MLLAGKPNLQAMFLALSPGFDAMLLGSQQVWADVLVCVEQEVLHACDQAMAQHTDRYICLHLTAALHQKAERLISVESAPVHCTM